MNKKVIATPSAPSAIGPYSQAIRAGEFLFVSGQIAIDPSANKLIEDTSVRAQTHRVLRNLQAIVTAAGGSIDNIVKTTVFLKDMNDFSEMNAVYGEFFRTNPPARSTVEVSRLPRDVSIEIDCIAVFD
jgi:2-iminobutanoate/2-iminopropanoate deaminase